MIVFPESFKSPSTVDVPSENVNFTGLQVLSNSAYGEKSGMEPFVSPEKPGFEKEEECVE